MAARCFSTIRRALNDGSLIDAERFGLIVAGDHTAIVVGQDVDRPTLQPRVEQPFASDLKVVEVNQVRKALSRLAMYRRLAV